MNGADSLGLGLIGAGRVGLALADALMAAGHDVAATTDSSRLRECPGLLPGADRVAAAEVVRRSRCILVTVPDDALPGLVQELSPHWQPGQVVVHTSGLHGLGVLAPVTEAGGFGVAMHPAMTFTGLGLDVSRLPGTVFSVTAYPLVEPLAEALVGALGGQMVRLAEADRVRYHAALCHGANHVVTVLSQARELLATAGFEDPSAVLRPLVQAAVDGVLTHDMAALTGPVARGDAGTVAKHVAELGATGQDVAPDVAQAYRTLVALTCARAESAGVLAADGAARIRAILADAER